MRKCIIPILLLFTDILLYMTERPIEGQLWVITGWEGRKLFALTDCAGTDSSLLPLSLQLFK
jgi:hypothetical protein